MRRGVIAGFILAVTLLCCASVFAYEPGITGICLSRSHAADAEKVKEFQRETLELRDALMVKKAEIRQEYAKTNPDRRKITDLQKELADIRSRIHEKAEECGLVLERCGTGEKRVLCRKMVAGGYSCEPRL